MHPSRASTRIQKEFEVLQREDIPGLKLLSRSAKGDLLLEITGPHETPFQGNRYIVLFRYPQEYPYKAPTIQFLTNIFHPNISKEGFVCIDILQNQVSPALTAQKYLLSVISLLGDPNTTDPFNPAAAKSLLEDKEEYSKMNRNPFPVNSDSSIMEELNKQGVSWKVVHDLKLSISKKKELR